MTYKIRRIEPSDNPYLATIIRNAFIEFDAPKTGTVYSDPTTDKLYELFSAKKNSCCFAALENETIVGCCGIYPTEGLDDNYAELVKFYLAKEARDKGIGKALFEKSIEESKKLGYSHLYIESQAKFANAVKLYERYGFKSLDHSLGNSGHENCGIWMLKVLT